MVHDATRSDTLKNVLNCFEIGHFEVLLNLTTFLFSSDSGNSHHLLSFMKNGIS